MLNIRFGKMPDVIYNTSVFFKNTYNPRWIIDPLTVKMIADVDRSRVVSEQLIENPAFQRLYQRSEDCLYALAADKLPAAHVLTEDSHL